MSVIRPKPPVDPIRFESAAPGAAGVVPERTDERLAAALEAARAAVLAEPVADLPDRLLAAYGTNRPESELFLVLRTARRIRDAVDRVVVIGGGDVVAGVRAMFEACCHPFHNELPRGERGGRPRLSFEGFGLDNDVTQGLLDLVAPPGRPRSDDLLDRWAVVLVGGADAPRATQAATQVFLAALRAAVGGDPRRLAELVVSIGAAAGQPDGCPGIEGDAAAFEIPAGCGAARGVFTAVGLLPASIVGIDVVRLLEGAAAMSRRFREAPAFSNPVLQWVAVVHGSETRSGATAGGLCSDSRQLQAVRLWYERLRSCALASAAGRPPGPPDTRLVVAEGRRDRLVVPAADPAAGGRDDLHDRTGATGPQPPAAVEAAGDGGLAAATIVLPRIDEHAIGQLLQMLLLATAVEGRLAESRPPAAHEPTATAAATMAEGGHRGRPG